MGASDIKTEDSWVWTDETPGLHFYLFLGNNFVLKKYIIFLPNFGVLHCFQLHSLEQQIH